VKGTTTTASKRKEKKKLVIGVAGPVMPMTAQKEGDKRRSSLLQSSQ